MAKSTKPDVNTLVAGKTIKKVQQCYDGGTLFDIIFDFTDGSQLSLMQTLRPLVPEVKFCPDLNFDDGDIEARIPSTR